MFQLEDITSKIITVDAWRARARAYQQVVFTNGCFDVLHRGHISYLSRARALGDCLVVGLNSDSSVKRLKGESRPINREGDRALLLAALQMVDYVILFAEDTPAQLIEQVQPQLLVKGGDYAISQIVGADFVLARGGKVLSLPFVDGYSSTKIIASL